MNKISKNEGCQNETSTEFKLPQILYNVRNLFYSFFDIAKKSFIFSKHNKIKEKNNLYLKWEENDISSGEIIANSPDIMSIIIGNIPRLKDRSSLRLTSSLFYKICNDKASLTPSFNVDEGIEPYISDRYKVKCCQNAVYLNIPENINFFKVEFINHTKIMETYFKRKPKLVIKDLPIELAGDLNNIGTIKNIETVIFKTTNQLSYSLYFLNSVPLLNPKNIVFEDFGRKFVEIKKEIFGFLSIEMPSSIKNIVLMCNRERCTSLLETFENFEKGTFDQITFGRFYTNGIVKKDHLMVASKIASYFKNVKIIFENNITNDINRSILELLNKFNLEVKAPVTYEISFYMSFVERMSSQIVVENFEENDHLLWEEYSKITVFRIFLNHKQVGVKFSDTQVESLRYGLSQMNNLTTFELQFDLIKTYDDFYNICKGFRKSLKNIKLYDISKFSIDHLKVLSTYGKNLEKVSLNGITCCSINLSIIISSFQKLKGLYVRFGKDYIFENIRNDIVIFDEAKGGELVKWPNLDFLEIICVLKISEFDILERMNRNTPRKSGKFMYFKYPILDIPFQEYSPDYRRIIIQKSTKNFEIFKKVFSNDTNDFGDETYFGYDPRKRF